YPNRVYLSQPFPPPTDPPPCAVDDFFAWRGGMSNMTRSVNLTGCSNGTHVITMRRPVNSCKHIRARIISQEVDSDYDLSRL
ncbi:hypothetical protein PENTCL1PPCAC_7904, partial [Pristionchus entomophagus]